MKLAAAIDWYRRGLVSQGKGAAIAAIPRADFIDALAARKIETSIPSTGTSSMPEAEAWEPRRQKLSAVVNSSRSVRAMKTTLRVEGEVTADGHLRIELPSDLPRGPVLVTLEPLRQDDLELAEDDLKGRGLTAEEIATSPEIGAWAGDEIRSGADYVEQLRRATPRYSW